MAVNTGDWVSNQEEIESRLPVTGSALYTADGAIDPSIYYSYVTGERAMTLPNGVKDRRVFIKFNDGGTLVPSSFEETGGFLVFEEKDRALLLFDGYFWHVISGTATVSV